MHNIISGIYVLYFEKDDGMFYIGKSINIPKRLSDHRGALKRGDHHNRKLQDLYNKYKEEPSEYVLEEVLEDVELNTREVYWINKFDSFHKGLNLTLGGDSVSSGEDHPGAIYPAETYIEVLYELAYTSTSPTELAKKLGISYNIVRNISEGINHTYLRQGHPEAYQAMRDKVGSRSTRKYSEDACIAIVKLLANTNFTLEDIACKCNTPVSLVKGISRGLYHKNIRNILPIEYEQMLAKLGSRFSGPKQGGRYPDVVSPEGIRYSVQNCQKFSTEHKLDNSTFNKLLRGGTQSHKGWRVYSD